MPLFITICGIPLYLQLPMQTKLYYLPLSTDVYSNNININVKLLLSIVFGDHYIYL